MNSILKQSDHVAIPDPPESLDRPALSFDLGDEVRQLREENIWQAGRKSKTLVKHPDFRLVLTALKAGTRLGEHNAAGAISVQTVVGHIQMHVQGSVFDLPCGHVLALEGAVAHDVEALEDSSFLLTIAWPPTAKKA